jgi:membrane-bound lytic murein transglycosylase D
MGRRVKNNSPAVMRRNNKSLGRLVRSILSSLAIPTLMTACAPVPHIDPGSGHLSVGSGRTILYVGSGRKHADMEAEAETSEGATPYQGGVSLAEQYGPPAPNFPPAGKLTSKHRAFRDVQFSAKWQFSGFGKLRSSQTASLNPPPMVKMPKDGIWDRVRKHLMLTAYEHESIQAEVDKIKRSPGTLNFISKRAEPFLFYVVDEIDRRGLPMDLAMVPMVESAFEPTAVSPKQAAGIWQFIPGTATNNGLRLVDGYDGRYDLYAATKAALKYLSHLQGLFGGDWLLALAAYNAGEGCVQRAIQANQKAGLGTSFWDLNLPAETKAYVPKVLALSRVIADPATHGVSLRKISILPYLARVEVQTTTVPLAETVAGLGMSWEEFYGQNPAFKPDVVPGTSFNLLLPLDKAQMLVASLQGSKLIAARKYVVKKGETLTVIAKQQGVTALKLAEWNGLQTDSRVKPGQELIIYPV